MKSNHGKINYLEYHAKNLEETKLFFSHVFGWKFIDYGSDYSAFSRDAGLDGGFFRSELSSSAKTGSALTVFYSDDLEATQKKVIESGGEICEPIFDFPGGRRFHFIEPSGNEFAVWSEK